MAEWCCSSHVGFWSWCRFFSIFVGIFSSIFSIHCVDIFKYRDTGSVFRYTDPCRLLVLDKQIQTYRVSSSVTTVHSMTESNAHKLTIQGFNVI